MAHLDAIDAHNAKFEAGLSTYKQGINQFSDLTFEEFENTVLMREQSYVQGENKASGVVGGKFHPDSHDCNGGWADRAFDTIITEGGDCRESDYPYTAHNGNGCKSFTPVVSISGYNFMNVKSEGIDALAESIYNNGPHTVYVYANSNFQRY